MAEPNPNNAASGSCPRGRKCQLKRPLPGVSLVIRIFLALVAVSLSTAVAEPVVVLGRCPLDRVVAISSGRFADTSDDVLVVQDVGRMELSRGPGRDKTVVNLRRLALLRLSGAAFRSVWQSEPFNSTTATASDIAGTCWTSGDVDADGLRELLLFTADSCQVLHFTPDTVTTNTYGLNGAWVEGAAVCDADGDGLPDIATLEVSGLDSTRTTRLMRLYRMTGSGLAPCLPYSVGINPGANVRIALLGSARLEDYPGELPVVASIYPTLKPSTYEVLYRPRSDSLVLTDKPFPWQEWFSKTRVLPAGELSLFDVGDTLVAYGYFVPGSRPSGPSQSFAALEDGEWRLLSLVESARRVSGPVCRFTRNGVAGWLELRDNLFYFHAGEIFRWRP
jgi:hypothetical protein